MSHNFFQEGATVKMNLDKHLGNLSVDPVAKAQSSTFTHMDTGENIPGKGW